MLMLQFVLRDLIDDCFSCVFQLSTTTDRTVVTLWHISPIKHSTCMLLHVKHCVCILLTIYNEPNADATECRCYIINGNLNATFKCINAFPLAALLKSPADFPANSYYIYSRRQIIIDNKMQYWIHKCAGNSDPNKTLKIFTEYTHASV